MNAAKIKSATVKKSPLDAHRFRYGLLAFDIVTILFIAGTSFIPRELWIYIPDEGRF